MSDKIYGEWTISDPPYPVVSVDRILGVQVSHDAKGRPDFVTVQYQSVDGDPFQSVRMPFVDAMFLLSCLKSMQLDEGLPFPDDPRG